VHLWLGNEFTFLHLKCFTFTSLFFSATDVVVAKMRQTAIRKTLHCF
jgi:hypothetical protein